MKLKEHIKSAELLHELEILKENKYIFRGQPYRAFFLLPNSFRNDTIRKMEKCYPSTNKYHKWRQSESLKKIVECYLNDNEQNPLIKLNVARLHELTIYLLQYNYFITKYIEKFPNKFDFSSLSTQNLRPLKFWQDEESFMYFFEFALRVSTGITLLDGTIINSPKISEILTAYDESLPQHYGVPTAAIDWTWNPYIAIYFSLKNISSRAKEIAIYAYKEIENALDNPISLVLPNPNSLNPRVINQEGLFTKMRYACFYYYRYGNWPSIEKFIPKNNNHFELIKFTLDTRDLDNLRQACKSKKITDEFLFPEKEHEFDYYV